MTVSRRGFLKLFGVGVGSVALGAAAAEPVSAESDLNSSAAEAAKHPSMLYDTTLCVGCHACQSGCRSWNETTPERDEIHGIYDAPTDLSGDTWTVIQLHVEEGEQPASDRSNWSFVKRNCMHCLDPACVSACTVGALQKSAAGPVIYDIGRCFGCRYCMIACPYHVPRYEWGTNTPLVQKCTFCFGRVQEEGGVDEKNRLTQGLGPMCVESCPTGALTWGTREEILAEAHNRIGTNPGKYFEDRVYGEEEAGGTLQLVLSHVPFEDLGLPALDPKPLPELTKAANWSVPGIIVGVGGLAGVAYLARSRNEEEDES